MRSRVLALVAATLLGLGTGVLTGCGDRSNLLAPTDARSLDEALEAIAAATSAGSCDAATNALSQANATLADLPSSVDARLRARLEKGMRNLEVRVPVACVEAQTTTEQTPTESTESTESTETETDTTTTDTTTTGTETTPTDTTTETTPTDTTPTDTGADPGASGGVTPEEDAG